MSNISSKKEHGEKVKKNRKQELKTNESVRDFIDDREEIRLKHEQNMREIDEEEKRYERRMDEGERIAKNIREQVEANERQIEVVKQESKEINSIVGEITPIFNQQIARLKAQLPHLKAMVGQPYKPEVLNRIVTSNEDVSRGKPRTVDVVEGFGDPEEVKKAREAAKAAKKDRK